MIVDPLTQTEQVVLRTINSLLNKKTRLSGINAFCGVIVWVLWAAYDITTSLASANTNSPSLFDRVSPMVAILLIIAWFVIPIAIGVFLGYVFTVRQRWQYDRMISDLATSPIGNSALQKIQAVLVWLEQTQAYPNLFFWTQYTTPAFSSHIRKLVAALPRT